MLKFFRNIFQKKLKNYPKLDIKVEDRSILKSINSYFEVETLQYILELICGTSEVKLIKWTLTESRQCESQLANVHFLKVKALLPQCRKLTLPLVIKSMPQNIDQLTTYCQTQARQSFAREIIFYTHIWPRFLDFLKNKELSFPDFVIPKLYFTHSDGKNDFLVFHDLNQLGYTLNFQQTDLTLTQCRFLMHLLAQFHSLSIAFYSHYPQESNDLLNVFTEDSVTQLPFETNNVMKSVCLLTLTALEQEKVDYYYIKKIKNITENDFDLQKMFQVLNKETNIKVLNHGSCYLKNFLFIPNIAFKKESVALIDFKNIRTHSPAIDLTHLLLTCAPTVIRRNYWQRLIDEYYGSLMHYLLIMNCPLSLFKKLDLQHDMIIYGKYGFGLTLEMLPYSLLEYPQDIHQFQQLMRENSAIPSSFQVKFIDFKSKRQKIVDLITDVVDRQIV